MKSFYLTLLSAIVLVSCDDSNKKERAYVPESLGNINSLQIVVENDLWNEDVGEEIRGLFAAPTDGLPQDEPMYSMSQQPPATFTGFARKYRLFLHTTIAEKDTMYIRKDPFARPQVGAFISATSPEGLVRLLKENQRRILDVFRDSEIKEKQKRIKLSLKKMDSLPERLGVSLEIPSAYRIAASSDEFYWMRKNLKSGSTNIIIYEVPLGTIVDDSTAVGDIIKMRDSIGGNHLPVEDNGHFITTEDYAPYLFTSEIDGKFAYETKGIWEVKDQYMAGPFLNYAVRDEANERYLILEGFSYAPAVSKRDLQFELEAILKSAKIE